MTPTRARLIRISVAILLASGIAAAPAIAGPAYIKLGDIKGESSDKDHKGEIEVLSWSWGATNAGSAGESVDRASSDPQEGGEVVREPGKVESPNLRARTRPTIGDMTITKGMDKGTQTLAQPASRGSLTAEVPAGTCTAGARYPLVTLRADDKLYELNDVTVASCKPVSAGKGKKDKAQLEYMHIEMKDLLVSG